MFLWLKTLATVSTKLREYGARVDDLASKRRFPIFYLLRSH